MNSNDRANLIKRINTLEGLTDKERSDLLGLLRENKTYGLVWEDKPEDVEERLREELPILTEVPERVIISEDNDAPNHILIEGDNLEATCYRDWETDRKSTRLNSSHRSLSRMPSSA